MKTRSAIAFTCILLSLSASGDDSSENVSPTCKASEEFYKSMKFTIEDFNRAYKEAEQMAKDRDKNEKLLRTKGLASTYVAPSFRIGTMSKDGISESRNAQFNQNIIRSLSKIMHEKVSSTGMGSILKHAHIQGLKSGKHGSCESERDVRFRRIDGSCNNLRHTNWGKTNTAQRRILPAKYGPDGVSPRTFDQTQNSKALSQKLLHSHKVVRDKLLNAMAASLGQFISSDINFTPMALMYDKGTGKAMRVKCCYPEAEKMYDDCFPIRISKENSFYKKHKVECFEFIRSAPAVVDKEDGISGPREQMNQVTSFFDGSQIYGSDSSRKDSLYDKDTGKLLTSRIHHRNEFLPRDRTKACQSKERQSCFLAGDDRVNTHLNMMVLHTVFLRLHNRFATFFKEKTKWDGRRIFEESRRIVGAILQAITYKEFLPAILNPTVLKKSGLEIGNNRTDYKDDVNPSILNEFSTAAFRFGHTLMLHKLEKADSDGHLIGDSPLSENYFNPDEIYENKNAIKEYVLGMFFDKSSAADNKITPAMTRQLFMKKGESHGQDIGALNIQRGRDHGLSSYAAYRQHLKGWANFTDVMSKENIDALNEAYGSMDKVDLYIGGSFENNLKNSAVGPTFSHIIAKQFKRLMDGDRYFYTHKNTGKVKFPTHKFDELQKISLAWVMCQTADLPKDCNLQTQGCKQACPAYMKTCEELPDVDMMAFTK